MSFNEDSNVSVTCVNRNNNFEGNSQWKAPDGSIISSTDSMNATFIIIRVTRHQAGTYTCYVPGVPEVPEAKFYLVVNCKWT